MVFLENVFLLRALCVYASVCYVAVSTIVAKRLRGPSYTFFGVRATTEDRDFALDLS